MKSSLSKGFGPRELAQWSTPVLLILFLAVVTLATALLGSTQVENMVTVALIRIVAVVGLYIFIGNSGIVSFGHITFMGIAAYAAAWQTCCEALKPMVMPGLPHFLLAGTVPLPISVATSTLLAGLAAFTIGLILMRLTGLGVSIASLAVLFIFQTVYSNWDSVTMGAASIVGLPEMVTPAKACGLAALSILLAYVYQRSRWAVLLRATRDDEVAARSVGVAPYWPRLIAFTLSGLVCGLAGVMQAHFLGTVSTEAYFLDLTFITLAMLIVGGTGSLTGAVVGAVVVQLITEVFRALENGVVLGTREYSLPGGVQEIVLAASLLLILTYRKFGITGGKEISLSSVRKPKAL